MTLEQELPRGAPLAAGYQAVLVPLDGSRRFEQALGPARMLADRFGAALHVVAAGVHRDESWWYQRYLDRVGADLPGVTTHRVGLPVVADGIVATARALDPCLVCMSTHGRARSAAVTGSTSAAVAARIGRPLVAIGPRVGALDAAAASDRLVVSLDGTPLAEEILPTAAAWARRFGLRLSLVTAADPVLLRSRLARERDEAVRPYGHHGDPLAYLRAVASLSPLGDLQVDSQVLWGLAYPHVVVGDHLDRHPALAVAATTHARRGVSRAVLGSDVARIVHRSPVPVLVQPPRSS